MFRPDGAQPEREGGPHTATASLGALPAGSPDGKLISHRAISSSFATVQWEPRMFHNIAKHAGRCHSWRRAQGIRTLVEQIVLARHHLFTQAGIFRAFSFPGFFLSTRRGSRVMHPAAGFISKRGSPIAPNTIGRSTGRARCRPAASDLAWGGPSTFRGDRGGADEQDKSTYHVVEQV